MAKGLAAAPTVLAALDRLASDDEFLAGPTVSFADLIFAAMLAYFVQAPEGDVLLHECPRLTAWWQGSATGRASWPPIPACRLRFRHIKS